MSLVPSSRLIASVFLIAFPAAVLAVAPGAEVPCLLLCGALAVLAISDAWLAQGTFRGLEASLPELVRLQKDRAGYLEIRWRHPAGPARRLRAGFAFPEEISTEEDDRWLILPAETEHSSVTWEITPRRRGRFFLEQIYLEEATPLKFWTLRTTRPVRTELRVFPDLRAEQKKVSAIFLRRNSLGIRAQRSAGQGREFEKLRDYVPGDSAEMISWKASAKRGHPVTKVFQVERTQEVYVIVDASRLSARVAGQQDGREVTVVERFVTAALMLGAAAEQQGDQYGLITFSDRVLNCVRARHGQAHFGACRDRLYELTAEGVTPDFEELCTFIRLRLRKRALLIFLTALDDPMLAESFTHASTLISRQHLVLVDMVQPPGVGPLFGDEPAGQLDQVYERLGGHLRWAELRDLQHTLRARRVRLSLLDPEKLSVELVAQHAEIKRRQLV